MAEGEVPGGARERERVEFDIARERERLYSDGSALSAGGDAGGVEGVPAPKGAGRNVQPPWLSHTDPQNIGGAPFVDFDDEGNDGTHAWSNKVGRCRLNRWNRC